MKTTIIILVTFISIVGYGQARKAAGRVNHSRGQMNVANGAGSATNQTETNNQSIQSRQTITDKYLNGPSRSTTGGTNTTNNSSPFAGGMQAGTNATRTFDTLTTNRNTAANNQTNNATIAGGNDTTFNVNTVAQGGVTTTSGAIDRSGQAQFGQTNWGNSRSTIGESQWTVPPPITASFNKEFPASNTATWVRNNVDTTIYSARYKSGAQWVVTNYNMSGQRLDTRTEYPLLQPPRAVTVYLAKQPSKLDAVTLYKLQVQGKPDVYEIRTRTGKTIYVNNDGMEVNY